MDAVSATGAASAGAACVEVRSIAAASATAGASAKTAIAAAAANFSFRNCAKDVATITDSNPSAASSKRHRQEAGYVIR